MAKYKGPAVLFEVVLSLVQDKLREAEDIAVNLIEFFKKLLKGSAVDVAQLTNKDRVKHPKIPQALQHSKGTEHSRRFVGIGLDAPDEVAVRSVQLLG